MGHDLSKLRQRRPTEDKFVAGLLPIGSLLSKKYTIKNLVFASGPMEGSSYAGAVRVLEKLGILENVKRFAGVGTGALVASVLAFGSDSKELQEYFNKYLENVLVDDQVGFFDLPSNLIETYGWNTGTKFFHWFSLLLESKFFNADLTFMQLYEKTGNELCIIVTNVDKSTTEYCHPKTTPNLPIKRAIFMSFSVPGVFSPIKYGPGIGKCLHVNGSVTCGYPIHAFDGWFLSMDTKDSILNKIESPEHFQLYDKMFNSKNEHTLGFFRIGKQQEPQYETFVDRLTKVNADIKFPATPEAEKYKIVSQKRISVATKFTSLRKICTSLLAIARCLEDEQGSVSVDSFAEKVFSDRSFRKERALFPEFGENKTDLREYLLVIGGTDCKLPISILKQFFQRKLISLLDEYSGCYKRSITDVRNYFTSVSDAVQYSNTILNTSDHDRSVGILCGHVSNNEVELDDEDQKYLYRQGWNATVSHLRQLN